MSDSADSPPPPSDSPPTSSRGRASTPRDRGSLVMAFVAVLAVTAFGLAGWAMLRSASGGSGSAPAYSDSQRADAKAQICAAFDTVRRGVSRNTNQRFLVVRAMSRELLRRRRTLASRYMTAVSICWPGWIRRHRHRWRTRFAGSRMALWISVRRRQPVRWTPTPTRPRGCAAPRRPTSRSVSCASSRRTPKRARDRQPTVTTDLVNKSGASFRPTTA